MHAFPDTLDISPVSRWPTTLPEATVRAVYAQKPLDGCPGRTTPGNPGSCPRPVSIIVVTMNNLVYTKLCLESLLAHTDEPAYEVIVVDNGSSDGTSEYLHNLAGRCSRVSIVLNDRNQGFARATNQGLVRARGRFLVLLNNDTLVPPGWLPRLLAHLATPAIGLVGPCTNRSGNEAQIDALYRTYGEFVEFAQAYHEQHRPQLLDIRTAVMFCTALRREIYDSVGPLDEHFEIGLFEDDDYAMRIRSAGFRVVCAEDVFVHHFGQASIGKLAIQGEYGKLFHANRLLWERKWHQPWTPHRRRDNPNYLKMIERLREVARRVVRPGATVLVASKGDEECVRISGVRGWHFPQLKDGEYAGYHPADSLAAIAHLEALRARGAEYFLIPGSAFWWLDHYPELHRHLEGRHERIFRREDTCVIYDLKKPAVDARSSWSCQLEQILADLDDSSAAPPSILDWGTGRGLAAMFQAQRVFSPPSDDSSLPYADRSIDVVALASTDEERMKEARRVATAVVASFNGASPGSDGEGKLEVEWVGNRCVKAADTVSIIVPCHNQMAFTQSCLTALTETLPRSFTGEILVADDASTDGTQALLEHWAERDCRVSVLRNQENQGFVRSCNQAAAMARGEFLVFLNNDTIPLPGWLPHLLQTFRDYPDAGAVGGKLIYPNGTLQEAGGVTFSDGTGANFGKGDCEVCHPLYEYVRRVDYCSGALLATPRSLFLKFGGFDAAYCPAYYEDTDYCFKLRQEGYHVYYQPESAIVHYEGGTAGVDLCCGMKQHQVINRETFVRRWSHVLQKQPAPPGRFDRRTWQDLASRTATRDSGEQAPGRALVCGPTMPEFDRESGSRRLFDLIDFLLGAGWSVTFACKSAGHARYARLLRQRGVATYAGTQVPWKDLITTGRFDLAVLAFWHIAEELLPLIRALSPKTRVLVDSVDLHFVRNARRLFRVAEARTPGRLDRNYGSETMRELNAYVAADGVLAVSQKEADMLDDLTGDCELAHAVPDGEGLVTSDVPFEERRGILFIGNFRHPPNVVAVEKLCTDILPRLDPELLARHPLSIIGHALDEKVQSFGKGLPNIHMVGWVPSLLPYLHSARITVVPLSYGAGTKRKLIQALMAGTPTVSTSTGVEGLNLVNEEHVLVADDPVCFAQAISRLLSDAPLWHRLASQGRERICNSHDCEIARTRFLQSVAAVLAREVKESPPVDPDSPPHLDPDGYEQLVQRIRDVAHAVLPDQATVLVVSRGDEQLLDLGKRRCWHFMRAKNGAYAGHHPANSAEAIRHLEGMRAQGADYLLFPATAFWWLDHYSEFRHHLDNRYRLLLRQDDACAIYELREAHKLAARLSEGES